MDRGARAALLIAVGAVLAAPAGPVVAAGYWPIAVGLVVVGIALVVQGLRTIRITHEPGGDGAASHRERR